MGTVGLLKNPTHVTLNEVKGLLSPVGSTSRRFFAELRMTERAFLAAPHFPYYFVLCPCHFALVIFVLEAARR